MEMNEPNQLHPLRTFHLFAGAGGGILADLINGHRPVGAVEINKHCQRVLQQRQTDGIFPFFPIFADVREFDGKPWEGLVDVVAGGFPCQAFSTASRGRRTAANLWPDMLKVVRDIKPRFVFAENVSAEAINCACDGLEKMGYPTRAVALGASNLGADHIRARYWLLAHADDESELFGKVDAEVAIGEKFHHSVWQTDPNESGMVDGVASRVDRYRAAGNGQVPIVAATAWNILRGEKWK